MLFLFKNNTFAGNNVVKLNPELGQGFLVLNKADYTNVDHWEITISQRTMNQDSTFNDSTVSQVNLPSGRNYWKVADQYKINTSSAHYRYTVSGYSDADKLIVTKDRGDLYHTYVPALCLGCGSTFHPTCSWTCNGTTYAWQIQQYTDQNGLSYLKLESTYDYQDPNTLVYIPYYFYMSASNFFNIYCQNHNCSQPFSVDIVGPLTGDLNTSFCDATGNIITGSVYGVAKDLGSWESIDGLSTTHLSFQPPVDCNTNNRPLSWALAVLNANAYSDPSLPVTCTPSPCITSYGGGSGDNPPPCLGMENGTDTAYYSNYWGYYQALVDCWKKNGLLGEVQTTSNPPGNPSPTPSWLSYINEIVFTDLNDANKPPIIIHVADLFSNEGLGNNSIDNWSGLNISLTPGLWCVGTVFNDGKYLPIIKEAATNENIHLNLSDLLQVAVQPTPLVDNKYKITFNSGANMKVNYELVDFSGNVLYQKDFVVHQGMEKTYTIVVHNQIPSGILFHRFTLDDGSVKSIETIKN